MTKAVRPLARKRVDEILRALEVAYPDAKAGLDFTSPFELLIATILSAQCTDKQVNKVTPGLFKAYPDAYAMAAATADEIAPYIRSCGFYATKSRNIAATCRRLVEAFDGQVPSDLDMLQTLPGVGRKTANVVVSNAFGADAIAVDTHVFRVSNRIGLANAKNVEKTEEQLMRAIPKEKWSVAHHWLIHHGRNVCIARAPKCGICTIAPFCKTFAGASAAQRGKRAKAPSAAEPPASGSVGG
jgi:endonuclease-3